MSSRQYSRLPVMAALLLSFNCVFAANETATPVPKTENAAAAPKNRPASNAPLKVGVVNFKLAVENSKAGKQEQANFEALKKQMDAVMDEREQSLNEIAAKFNDPDYLDSLSTDAENELKHKFRVLSQEMNQIQTQYYQALQQANMKILQELNDQVSEASAQVAKEGKFDMIVNDENCFYSSDALDVTKEVVATMDKNFAKKQKEEVKEKAN